MKKFSIKSFGPIDHADIELGDLTVFVGPQATGKSLALQIIKLALDGQYVGSQLIQYLYRWNNWKEFLDIFLGKGMSSVWKTSPETSIHLDGKAVKKITIQDSIRYNGSAKKTVVYIPAQRVLTIHQGQPVLFGDVSPDFPYVVREFSQSLHQLLFENRYFERKKGKVFPNESKLKKVIRDRIQEDLYHDFVVNFGTIDMKTKLYLQQVNNVENPLQIGSWSTGQREFFPLLLGLYQVLSSGRITKHPDIEYIIIEEPEMGLHPRAIVNFMLSVLDCMQRGYRVIVSTHSPTILETIWAIQGMKSMKADWSSLKDLFEISERPQQVKSMFENALSSTYRTYFFKNTKGSTITTDISSLDPFGDSDIADWGGITELSSRVSEVLTNHS